MESAGRADVSVRPARSGDAAAIAEVQLETWRGQYASILPEGVVSSIGAAEAESRWRDAIQEPPSGDHLVFVALEAGRLVGFCAVGPGTDDDAGDAGGEILELLVGRGSQREGHGSRLLSAAIDHLENRYYRRAVAWRFEADEPALDFFRSAGWAADGSRRTLDMGEQVVQVRLHTEIGISVAPLG
jgi:ribosomal protein S18 acetylase RimI-like enzyme